MQSCYLDGEMSHAQLLWSCVGAAMVRYLKHQSELGQYQWE